MTKSKRAKPIAVKPATAAEMLDCSRQHIYKLIARGELQRVHIGEPGCSRVLVAEIYALVGLNPDGEPHAERQETDG